MKKILIYIGIAIAAICCTKDPEIDSQRDDNAITFTSNITTRAQKNQWVENDTIGVYMTYADSDFGSNGANVEYTTKGNGTFTSDNPLYLPSSGTASILAYYPYDKSVNITEYLIKSEDQVDLLSATNNNVSSSTVALTFDHLLSKVSLTIESGYGVTTAELDNLEVELSGISTKATFNVKTSEVNKDLSGDTPLELTTIITKNEDQTTINNISSSAIVIPQTLSGATLYFTSEDNKTFSATLATEEFKVGMEYTYTATINENSVEITYSNIDIWDEGGTVPGTADIVDIELKSGTYYINSAKGLAAFSDLVYGAGSNTKSATFAGFDADSFKTSNTGINGVLTRDIDLSDVCSDGVSSWNPIGRYYVNTTYYYQGEFDGGGYCVSGLYINSSSKQALFGYIGTKGVVYNLGVSGEVIGSSSEVGGIASWNEGWLINCYSEVNVSGTTNIAGIAAYNVGNVVNCYNRGDISGKTNVGGIVGQNAAGGYVGYCYSVGGITGTERVGGVVGWNHTTTATDPTIKGSFCLDNTTYSIGQYEYVASSGGITSNVSTAEYLSSDIFATIINNGSYTYNSNNTSPVDACAWGDNSLGDYPTLNFGVVNTKLNWIYDIIYSDLTYNIYTAMGLKAFATLVNSGDLTSLYEAGLVSSGGETYFESVSTAQVNISGKLMNDIDLNNEEWTPIGNDSYKYNGTFNGGGYLVSNLSVTNATYAGLFGTTNSSAKIYNLGVSGSVGSSESSSIVGGIVGNNSGSLTNCYNECSVSGSNRVGGVAGWNGGTIANCYNKGSVGNDTYIGGVVGDSYSGTITNCFNVYTNGNVVGSGSNVTPTNSYYLRISDADSNIESLISSYMQSEFFATYLNILADKYNLDYPNATESCAWIYNSGNYPTLNFGANPEMYYWTLDMITSSNYPAGDIWYITDASVDSATDFNTLKEVLSSVNSNGDITVVFSNLEILPENSFSDWKYLTSISLPSATQIGDSAYSGCTNLSSVTLPSAVTIGASAFSGCSILESILLPSATQIGDAAFNNCPKLTELDLGSSGYGISLIGNGAFGGTTATTGINLTIRIASDVSVSGSILTYNGDDAAEFNSITEITEWVISGN